MVVGLTCVWDLTHLHGLCETQNSTSMEAIGSMLKTWMRGGGADAVTPIHVSFCLIHKSHACHGESSKVEHDVWWLKESWNVSKKKEFCKWSWCSIIKQDKEKSEANGCSSEVTKGHKNASASYTKASIAQKRLCLVEKRERESMFKTTLLTNLSAIKVYQATFFDYYIN